MTIETSILGGYREVSFTIRDNFTASIEDAGDREIVLEALKNVNGSGITSNNPEVNEVIENLRYIQEVLSMELPEIEGEVTVGTVEDILTGDGCNYCLWMNGELWSNYTGYEAVENSIRAYHKGKTSVPEFSGREDKAEILSSLTKTLQLTGAGCDIREITYEKDSIIDKCLIRLRQRYEKITDSKGLGLVMPTRTGYYVTPNNYNKVIHRILDKLEEKHLSSHKLRHSFISYLVNDGKRDLSTVASIVGHGDTRVTLKYANHTQDEKAKEAIRMVSRLTMGFDKRDEISNE